MISTFKNNAVVRNRKRRLGSESSKHYVQKRKRNSSGSTKHHVLYGGKQKKMENEMRNMEGENSLFVTSSSSTTNTSFFFHLSSLEQNAKTINYVHSSFFLRAKCRKLLNTINRANGKQRKKSERFGPVEEQFYVASTTTFLPRQ